MYEPTTTTIEWGPAHLRDEDTDFDFTPDDN